VKKLYVIPLELADCTCDPHSVLFDDVRQALQGLYVVLESDLIQSIRVIFYTDTKDDEVFDFESDRFTDSERAADTKEDGTPKRPPLNFDVKHKVPPFFQRDADVPASQHLRPGLTGIRDLLEFIPQRIADGYEVNHFEVGVVWAFAGDSSCSDYIQVVAGEYNRDTRVWNGENQSGPVTVMFDSQDWFAGMDGHDENYRRLGELVGKQVDMSRCVSEVVPYGTTS